MSDQKESNQQPKPASSSDSAKKTILLVEDSPEILLLIKRMLTKAGYNVLVAQDGREAVRLARDSESDLILMDLEMPVMDGWQAMKQIREDGYGKPVVALTSASAQAHRSRAMAMGFNDYLQKPIPLLDMLNTIERYIGS